MQTIDFARSFLTFRIDLEKKPPKTVSHKPPFTVNNARIVLDCRCEIVDRRTGQSQEFVLGANCKTERVGVERDIWTDPNADFVPVAHKDYFMALKSWNYVGRKVMLYPPSLGQQPERQIELASEALDSLRIDIRRCEGEVLPTKDAIIDATLNNQPLVARTEIASDRYQAVLEYPVKTMNASERDKIFQTDTGPVLLPDLSREPGDLIGGLELAFAAFNSPDWTEFIVRVPTPVAEGVSVYHYTRTVRYDCRNQIIRLA